VKRRLARFAELALRIFIEERRIELRRFKKFILG
jgi:hypothetical protein